MTNAIRCSKCAYFEKMYQAPLGKTVRNQYAPRPHVYDECSACGGTGYIPSIVIDAIKRAFPAKAETILPTVVWSGDHWSFNIAGMYVGVEPDGYIHS